MNGKPVHEVPAKSVLNLESGFVHKLLCDGPTFTMGSACAYSCTFCYVEDLMRKNPHWQQVIKSQPGAHFEDVVIRRRGGVEALRKQLTFADGTPRFLADDQAGRVIYASPLVDVAANLELVRETVEACAAILELTRWDIRLLSKSTFLPRVAELLEAHPLNTQLSTLNPRRRVIYGVSTGTLDDGIALAFERGTPKVSKRLESLHKLQDAGCRTFGMLCPSLPLPDGDYAGMARAMFDAVRADRCEHTWGEVINVRGDSMTRTVAALHEAGYASHARELEHTATDKAAWEQYARATFEGHVAAGYAPGQLRFLQYVTAASKPWWKEREPIGAILL
jgi:DNA repair photolyase